MIAGEIVFERCAIHSSQLASDKGPEPIQQNLDAAQTARLIEDMLGKPQTVPAPIAAQVEQIVALHQAMQDKLASRIALQAFQRNAD